MGRSGAGLLGGAEGGLEPEAPVSVEAMLGFGDLGGAAEGALRRQGPLPAATPAPREIDQHFASGEVVVVFLENEVELVSGQVTRREVLMVRDSASGAEGGVRDRDGRVRREFQNDPGADRLELPRSFARGSRGRIESSESSNRPLCPPLPLRRKNPLSLYRERFPRARTRAAGARVNSPSAVPELHRSPFFLEVQNDPGTDRLAPANREQDVEVVLPRRAGRAASGGQARARGAYAR